MKRQNYINATQFFQNFFNTILSFIKLFVFAKFNIKLKKLDNNKGIILLGNGPSLNITLEKYKETIIKNTCLAVNNFAFSSGYDVIKPKYYLIIAPEYWMKNPPNQIHIDNRNKLINHIVNQTTWQMAMVLPVSAKKTSFVYQLSQNKNIEFIFINNQAFEGYRSLSFFMWKKNWGGPRFHNVLAPAILFACNVGYQNIFITGADHSWHEEMRIDMDNEFTINHQHFYDKAETRHAQYKLEGEKYHIHDSFRKIYLAFKGYHELNQYCTYRNCNVFNASEKSYIDAFQRSKLNEL